MVSGKKILYYSTLTVLLIYFLFLGLAKAKGFLAPLMVAAILALLVLPLSHKMERGVFSRGAASLTNTIFLFLISLGFFALLSMQVKNLVDNWSDIKNTMQPKIEQLRGFVLEHTPISQSDLGSSSEKTIIPFMGNVSSPAQKAASIFSKFISFMGTYLLTFVYVFFILNYRRHFKKFLLRLFPDRDKEEVKDVLTNSAKVTQQYLIGKLLLIAFLAILYAIGLGISGVNNFILISVIAALFSLIPYVGNIIGFGMALIFGYLTSGDPTVLLGIVITFAVAQFVESYILEPYVVGDKVDLHPFIVILVVVIGNMVWGIVGMIIAIPILAMINVVMHHIAPLQPFSFLLSDEDSHD